MTTGRINQVESVTDPARRAADAPREGKLWTDTAAGIFPRNPII